MWILGDNMELLMEVVFGCAALAGILFTQSMIYLFKAIYEFNRLLKQYQ